ncbi:photosynthetic NDH subunit of subcomplex B 5, chloroplastic [Telopea speciosissima]|uniref:photosynthetic NDH subunit of subcomplex B 5, chloroplastic n=1 Tax=Telopea speciosissima TaxID=54955 RepID=UPI001CC38743|nr:photosynthetic NDH subunit of subcomplex B 5, chloroplastic [Telopea speciosissima]
MATSSSTPSVLFTNPVPKIISKPSSEVVVRVPSKTLRSLHLNCRRNHNGSTRLNAAGLSEIEPDLNEDKIDRWRTNGISPEDFVYGEYDGHHTYHEGHEKGTFWGAVAEDYAAVEPPTGFQGLISWIFPPAVAVGYAYHVPGDYIFIGAAVFVVIFCAIEMGKPDKPHNFEPQIYNMERGARDKLISDYNTMDIWDFNEKYGDLWDFTVKKDDIEKR